MSPDKIYLANAENVTIIIIIKIIIFCIFNVRKYSSVSYEMVG